MTRVSPRLLLFLLFLLPFTFSVEDIDANPQPWFKTTGEPRPVRHRLRKLEGLSPYVSWLSSLTRDTSFARYYQREHDYDWTIVCIMRAFLRKVWQPFRRNPLTTLPSTAPSSTMTPTLRPSHIPTAQPSVTPSHQPSKDPSAPPTFTSLPSKNPTSMPSFQPSSSPSGAPSSVPSSRPVGPHEVCYFIEKDKTPCRSHLVSIHTDPIARTLGHYEDRYRGHLCSPNHNFRFGMIFASDEWSMCLCKGQRKMWCADDRRRSVRSYDEVPYAVLETDGRLVLFSKKTGFRQREPKSMWQSTLSSSTEDPALGTKLRLQNNGELTITPLMNASQVLWRADKENWEPPVL